MKRRGFTIVELIIVITIIGILLTLAVVSLQGTQVKARDDERKADIASIATHLESYFKEGDDTDDSGYHASRYPYGGFISNPRSLLIDLDEKSIIAPGASDAASSFIIATNNNESSTSVTPQPSISQYVYQPLNSNGDLCLLDTDECRKYNLFYRLEEDNTVYKHESKNR